MSEKFNSYPSLPPEIQNSIHGILKVLLGSVVWLDPPYNPEGLLFRVKFWGEKTPGIILKPKSTKQDSISNIAIYTIRCTQPIFTNYLNDMSTLTIDTMDAQWRLIGQIHINVRLYIKRDPVMAKGKLASNSGFANLEVDGVFPILTCENEPRKIGEIEIKAFTNYHGWENERTSKEVLASFEMNELKARFEDPIGNIEERKVQDDDRIPNSYANKNRGEYNKEKLDEMKLEIEGKNIEIYKKNDPSKIFVPKSSLKKIPKPEHAVDEEVKATEKNIEKDINPPSLSTEWEKVKAKGDSLKAKLLVAKAEEIALTTSVEQSKIDEGRIPSVHEVEAMMLPEDITVAKLPGPTDIFEVPEREKKPFSDLTSMKHLKLSISTLTLLIDKSELKDKSLFLECIVPVPTLVQRTPSEKLQNSPISIFMDSFKITNKNISNNLYTFNHESVHHLGLGEGIFGKLANQNIRIKLCTSETKEKPIELGRADILWEKILLAPGFIYSETIDLIGEDKNPRARKNTKARVIGRLNASFFMVSDENKDLKIAEANKKEEVKVEEKHEEILKNYSSEKPSQELEFKSFQLYLYIESVSQVVRSDGSLPNIFINYKTFPDPEKISTPVFWECDETKKINHKMMIPITATESIVSKLRNAFITLEVWDKISTAKDELLGLVKLQLNFFATALSSGNLALFNSVYPIIAVDEYRPINNLRTAKDIGYLRVCLALGTPAQVHRLHLSQSNADNNSEKFSFTNKRQDKKEQEIEVKVYEEKNWNQKTSKKEEKNEWDIENVKGKQDKIVTESIESIGDIAAFLNTKPQQETVKESPVIELPVKVEPQPLAELPKQSPKIEKIFEEPKMQEIPKEKTKEELVFFIKKCLDIEEVSIEEELKIVDRFNHRFIHSENFSHLLQELRLGIPPNDIQALIDLIISESPETSNKRRIQFIDIFHTLGIQPKSSNTKHSFSLTLKDIFACPFLTKLPNKSTYLKYLFPKEETYMESELLEANNSVSINISSLHSFTLPNHSDISECFSSEDEGIIIYLCRNVSRSEDQVIAKAVLPIEELVDLEPNKKITRVVCLYGDRNIKVESYLNEVIGKIRLVIEYKQSMTFDDPGKSVELVYEKQTQIDRVLPRQNMLTIFIENLGDLSRAQRYLKNLGIEIDQKCKVKVLVNIFCEDESLNKEFGVLEIDERDFGENVSIREKYQIEMTLNSEILNYLKNKSATIKVILISKSYEEITLGTTKISLIPLLLHSNAAGEFALLNEYGQFMGYINISFSFQIDDTRPQSPEQLEIAEEPKPLKNPNLPDLEPLPTLMIEEEPNTSKVQLTIESAMHLPKEINGEISNPFIQFKWFDSQTYKTPPVLRSSCPSWNSSHTLNIPLDSSKLRKPIIFEIWHRSFTNHSDTKLGECEVDLSALMVVDQIDGWYHIMDSFKSSGQLKIRITPTENLYEKITGKQRKNSRAPSPAPKLREIEEKPKKKNVYEERISLISKSLENENDEEIYQKHLENMRTLESITHNYGSWGLNRDRSPPRIEQDKAAFRHTSPLRKSRVSPPKYFEEAEEKQRQYNFSDIWKENTNLAPHYSEEIAHVEPHYGREFIKYEEEEKKLDSDEEWDQNKINDILSSIEEATKLADQLQQDQYQLPIEEEKKPEESHIRAYSSDYREPTLLRPPGRISPTNLVKNPLPNMMVTDSEISRIAAIMKGKMS
ncbi:unnamed protein product [Blepharisma stoltei]|uniref:C2 domain-containing protein n=1 Tax=Blepharisma stoltei TaxID=1481888 RepID=A0AAU9JN41_9CILI|nr:unnamed protein product [Blepharisma stoltei]